MQAEVISIGDELTTGQRLDTNSQWLSERLCELGVQVMYHTTVADDLEANVRVFRAAVERADVVIATGGLGPTADDLTREALAQVLGVPLELDQGSLDHIKALFARRTRPMPERNVVQAMFPVGTRPIFNPQGTAPGIEAAVPRNTSRGTSHVFCLPGVPAEMFQMWQASVAPALVRLGAGARVLVHHRIKCFGVGESDLEQMLPDLIRRGREPQVGITVSGATITLRITAAGHNANECRRAMQTTIDTIHQCLGTIVFGEEEEELEHAICRLLRQRGQTLATVEWGTGGLISHWFGELAEPCPHYLGGLTINDASDLLRTADLPADLLPAHGPHSAQLVAALAERCRLRHGADLALAVGPFPKVDPQARPESVHFSVASAEGAVTASAPFAGHPSILKVRAAKQALNLLRLRLLRAGG
jgi:nicotinamide-nucleotide amidase